MVTDRYGDETDENDSDNVAEDYKGSLMQFALKKYITRVKQTTRLT